MYIKIHAIHVVAMVTVRYFACYEERLSARRLSIYSWINKILASILVLFFLSRYFSVRQNARLAGVFPSRRIERAARRSPSLFAIQRPPNLAFGHRKPNHLRSSGLLRISKRATDGRQRRLSDDDDEQHSCKVANNRFLK